MKDFMGFELHVGDKVIMKLPGSSGFTRGRILKLNKKQVRIEYGKNKATTSKYPEDLVRILFTPENYKLIKFAMGVDGEETGE